MAYQDVDSSSKSATSSSALAQDPWALSRWSSWATAPTEQEEEEPKRAASTTDAGWMSLAENGRIGFERFIGVGVGRGGQATISVGYGVRAQLMAIKVFHGRTSERDFQKYEGMYEILKSAKPECRLLEIFSYERVPEDEGMTRLVTEYCEGENLLDLIDRHDKAALDVPESFIWTVFNDMTRALAFLQLGKGCKLPIIMEMPIIHHDIKPENIMIVGANEARPRCKLVDFDLATYYDKDDTRSFEGGTTRWNPPEQWVDFNTAYPTPAGDIWALGAVIHALATRKSPADIYECTAAYCPGEKYCGAHSTSVYAYGDRSEETIAKIENAIQEAEDEGDRKKWKLKDRFHCKPVWRIDVPSPDEEEAYSPELNTWMLACLAQNPADRITIRQLYDAMLDGKLSSGDTEVSSESSASKNGFNGFIYKYPKLWELDFTEAVQIDPKKEFGRYESDAEEQQGGSEEQDEWGW